MDYKNITRQYYCGTENVEKFVFSNVSKTMSGIIERPTQTNKTKIVNAFSGVNQDSQSSPYRCRYELVRYPDESRSRSVATNLQLLTENVDIPALEYYNFSH